MFFPLLYGAKIAHFLCTCKDNKHFNYIQRVVTN
nr:MAG TPA: hypothetical protein [Caudoviricetes sp.]